MVALFYLTAPTTVALPSTIGDTPSAPHLALKSLGLQVEVNTNQLQSNWGIVMAKSAKVTLGKVAKPGMTEIISS